MVSQDGVVRTVRLLVPMSKRIDPFLINMSPCQEMMQYNSVWRRYAIMFPHAVLHTANQCHAYNNPLCIILYIPLHQMRLRVVGLLFALHHYRMTILTRTYLCVFWGLISLHVGSGGRGCWLLEECSIWGHI